jgi:DUF1680 family protein
MLMQRLVPLTLPQIKIDAYTQSHSPVREQSIPVGHAVRAMYLYSAMADLAAEFAGLPFKASPHFHRDNHTAGEMLVWIRGE